MTDSGAASLDFSKAEFEGDGSKLQCSTCPNEISDRYYQINQQIVCPRCREGLRGLERSDGKAGRVARAAIFGAIGGAVGAAVWYAVGALFKLEIGLIAIAVGWLVGTGVARGSEGRGGLGYQLLAVFITYASIVTTYIPDTISAFTKEPQVSSDVVTKEEAAKDVPSAGTTTSPAGAGAAASTPPVTLGTAVGALGLGIVAVYAIAFAAPFLAGWENAIGILIILIALHQAWTLNRKPVLDIQGPFRVKPPLPAPEEATPGLKE